MTNTATVLSTLDHFGRGLAEAMLVPSLEALLLGFAVWLGLKFDRNTAPRIRHSLWLLVILKPLISLFLPWQGPVPLPVASETIVSANTYILSVADYSYTAIAIIWGVAITAGILWTCIGLVLLACRSRQTMPVEIPWVQALFSRCLKLVGISKPVELRMSDDFVGPTLIAVGKPVVVMPSWCLIDLSPQEIKQVFLHELMHYNRRDHLTLFLVHLAKICFFFHPLVWYAGRRIGMEAERACDMAVVNVSHRPQSYAASLLKVAEGPITRRWRGVLELARSASLTAIRIREVLTGFDGQGYALSRKAVYVLFLCGAGSLLPLFHVPVQQLVSKVVHMVEYDPISPAISGLDPVMQTLSSTDAVPVLSIPSQTDGNGLYGLHPVRPLPNKERQVVKQSGKPLARSPVVSDIVGPASMLKTGPLARSTPVVRSSLLGLSPLPQSSKVSHTGTSQFDPGKIEVQGFGQMTALQGAAYSTSLRAGYFVTREHELGGILSVVGPGEQQDEMQRDASPSGLFRTGRMATRPISTRLVPESPVNETLLGKRAKEEENAPSYQTLRLGAFYRYNITGLSNMVVPFVSLGTGVELRTGRNPVLVDGGGGIRCFFTSRAALIVQVDYIKYVVFSTRSRVNTSLGFSTIF